MKITDFRRLKKFMMMTMSGVDAEVLFAIKKANELLVAESVDWDRVLDRMVSLDVESASAYEPDAAVGREVKSEEARIDDAFREIEADDPRGSFADFIASLKDQWEKRRSLSEKQKDSLFRAQANARSRR